MRPSESLGKNMFKIFITTRAVSGTEYGWSGRRPGRFHRADARAKSQAGERLSVQWTEVMILSFGVQVVE